MEPSAAHLPPQYPIQLIAGNGGNAIEAGPCSSSKTARFASRIVSHISVCTVPDLSKLPELLHLPTSPAGRRERSIAGRIALHRSLSEPVSQKLYKFVTGVVAGKHQLAITEPASTLLIQGLSAAENKPDYSSTQTVQSSSLPENNQELCSFVQSMTRATNDQSTEKHTPLMATDEALALSLGTVRHTTEPLKLPQNWDETTLSFCDVRQNYYRKNCFFLSALSFATLFPESEKALKSAITFSDCRRYACINLHDPELKKDYHVIVSTNTLQDASTGANLLSNSQSWVYLFEKAYLALCIFKSDQLKERITVEEEKWEHVEMEECEMAEPTSLSTQTTDTRDDISDFCDLTPDFTDSNLALKFLRQEWLSLDSQQSPLDYGNPGKAISILNLNHLTLKEYPAQMHNLQTIASMDKPMLLGTVNQIAPELINFGLRCSHVYIGIGACSEKKDGSSDTPGILLFDPYGLSDEQAFNSATGALFCDDTGSRIMIRPADSPFKFLPLNKADKLVNTVWMKEELVSEADSA